MAKTFLSALLLIFLSGSVRAFLHGGFSLSKIAPLQSQSVKRFPAKIFPIMALTGREKVNIFDSSSQLIAAIDIISLL